MRIIELECKKCKYSFTRLVKSRSELKNEKCGKCGGDAKVVNDVFLGKPKSCGSCAGCGGGCSSKATKKKT